MDCTKAHCTGRVYFGFEFGETNLRRVVHRGTNYRYVFSNTSAGGVLNLFNLASRMSFASIQIIVVLTKYS